MDKIPWCDHSNESSLRVLSHGSGGQGRGAPLIFRPNWGSKGCKNFFGGLPPPPYLRVWMTTPPPSPPPLISRYGSGTAWCYLTLRYLDILSNFGPKVTVGSDRLKGIDRFPSLISKWLLQTLEKHENYRKAKWEHECAKVKMINCVRCVLSVITSILTDNVTWTCRGPFQPKTTSTSLLQLKVFSRITSDLLWI